MKQVKIKPTIPKPKMYRPKKSKVANIRVPRIAGMINPLRFNK